MSLRQWVLNHQQLLRRMLSWPVLWQAASSAIIKHIEHADSGDCLLCAAKLRALKYAHTPMLDSDRQVFCRKCGLTLNRWNIVPLCSNKRPPIPPAVKSSSPIAVRINW